MLGSSEQLELFSWLKADNTNCISVHLAELLTLLYLQLVKPFYVEEQIIQLYSVTEVATFHITGSDLSLPRSDYAYLGVLGWLINCAYSAPSSPRSTAGQIFFDVDDRELEPFDKKRERFKI